MKAKAGLICALLLLSSDAYAGFFFFFLPSSVTKKIGDKIIGAEGDSCVSTSAKVGDVLKSASGNMATIKSLSGKSSICQNPTLPIRALLEVQVNFSPKAGIDLPDDYVAKDVSDTDRFNGILLKALGSSGNVGITVSASKRQTAADPHVLAQNISSRMLAVLDDASAGNESETEVNGLPALRFEVTGKSKALFHPQFTYLVTLIEGPDEFVSVISYAKTGDYPKFRATFDALPSRVTGLQEAAAVAPNAGQPREQATAAASSSVSGNVADRLRDLDKLFKEGVISKGDYEEKKKSLLSEL